jgi:hypothetical protein
MLKTVLNADFLSESLSMPLFLWWINYESLKVVLEARSFCGMPVACSTNGNSGLE